MATSKKSVSDRQGQEREERSLTSAGCLLVSTGPPCLLHTDDAGVEFPPVELEHSPLRVSIVHE